MSNSPQAICGLLRSHGVANLRIDSRQVHRDDAFVAMAGVAGLHGAKFIDSAMDRGARCVLIDRADLPMVSERVDPNNVFCVDGLHKHLPEIAALFYGRPSEALPVVGITGTDGKSSSAYFGAQLASGAQGEAWFIGTVGYGPWSALCEQENTTPSVVDVHRLLREAADAGAPAVFMEVSSHAIDQGRVGQVRFAARILTNLGQDHLDYHGTLEIYHRLKTQWLLAGGDMAFSLRPALGTQVEVSDLQASPQGLRWQCRCDPTQLSLQAPLIGDFHSENISLALIAALRLGLISEAQAPTKVTALLPVPGRMQLHRQAGQPTVVVDFAHTAEALSRALQALDAHGFGLTTVVFGCGGDRDKAKRPLMMQAAVSGAQRVVVTSDNPRGEAPLDIIDDILVGSADTQIPVTVEADRRRATELAIEQTDDQGVVLVAGKGHESYQIVGQEKHHYSDNETVQALLGLSDD